MVDHELDQVAFQQLEDHIDSCEPCRKAVAVLALGSQPTGTPKNGDPWVAPLDRARGTHFESAQDRYAIANELGSGGMGRILSVFDRQLNRTVALKELREQRPELEARFRREAMLTARLEHPNIVSLHEAGTWPSGEPFYTMRLVSGRPLNKVIADAKTFAERIALLSHVIAVADALAYAHQQGIIHRDLKPQNVMVGEFGETVVIDWGLAKDLAALTDESGAGAEPVDNSATRVGEVLGTPAYMSPEQASAKPVDARADVYAIGAILYHLLAGEAPYAGMTGREVVDAVRVRPPAPLSADDGIPRDLLAIVDRAMARDPAARYPTARELREDLRRFHSGQLVGAHRYTIGQLARRWLRRHRTAVTVAAAAVVFLAGLAVVSVQRIVREQQRADAQRALAEKNRAQAEDLMRFMLFDLKDKLEPIGKLELLDAVAKKATAYYERLPESVGDDERRQRAMVRTNLGDVLQDQGDMTAALSQYRAALALRANLAAREPTNASTQLELARAHRDVGDVLRAQGNPTAALAEYRAAMTIGESLSKRDPSSAWHRDVSASHDKIGSVLLAQGNADEALAAHRRALQIREDLAAKHPNDVVLQRNVAVSHNKIGDVLFAKQDLPNALVEYRTMLAIRDKILAKDPANAAVQREVSISHDNIGDVLRAQNQNAGALAEYRLALTVSQKLAAQDPTNATWQRDLAVAHTKVGEELRAQPNGVKAGLAEYRAALAISSQLAAKDPTNVEWQRDVVVIREHVGDALLALQDHAGALAEFRAILPIKEKLAAQDPMNVVLQRDISVSHAAIGDVLRAQGNAKAALEEYRVDLAMTEKRAARDPSNNAWRHDLSVSHSNIGKALEALGKPTEARDAYRAALALAEQLATTDPTNEQWKQELAALQRGVATCCARRR